jgi:hypothetical protein
MRILKQALLVISFGSVGYVAGLMLLGCCFTMRFAVHGELVPDGYLDPVPPQRIALALQSGTLTLVTMMRLPYSSNWFSIPINPVVVTVITTISSIAVGVFIARKIR